MIIDLENDKNETVVVFGVGSLAMSIAVEPGRYQSNGFIKLIEIDRRDTSTEVAKAQIGDKIEVDDKILDEDEIKIPVTLEFLNEFISDLETLNENSPKGDARFKLNFINGVYYFDMTAMLVPGLKALRFTIGRLKELREAMQEADKKMEILSDIEEGEAASMAFNDIIAKFFERDED